MNIIENMVYHRSCLFYKGALTQMDIESATQRDDGSVNEVALYTLANWHIYEKKDTIKAKTYYDQLLANGNPYSFAALAGKSDYKAIYGALPIN